MMDVVTTPGFVHLPPRERLVRHAMNKIRERVRPEVTRDEVEDLCERFASGEFLVDLHDQDLGGRDTYLTRLWGVKVRAVFDTRYGALVTVIDGWLDQPHRRSRK